ncbi:MAG: MBL fold metallo-hydrolase, partial [Methylococcales bacterium]|nr:MBL fold metallo-hydrolase [Methylococcales bacterium]
MHPIFLFTHTQYFIMRLLLLINILILTACSTGMTARTSHAPESTARQTTQTSTQKISAVAAWNKSPKITRKNKATISVMERSGVKIHTYLSSHLQATYIIESKNNLVLIDSQFSKEDALDFRAYANSLNKKIERIILTHSHQDHILGYGFAFSDIEGYALEVSKKAIEK